MSSPALVAAVTVLASTSGAMSFGPAGGDRWSFLVMGDWGGSQDAPYSTPGEVNASIDLAQISRY